MAAEFLQSTHSLFNICLDFEYPKYHSVNDTQNAGTIKKYDTRRFLLRILTGPISLLQQS